MNSYIIRFTYLLPGQNVWLSNCRKSLGTYTFGMKNRGTLASVPNNVSFLARIFVKKNTKTPQKLISALAIKLSVKVGDYLHRDHRQKHRKSGCGAGDGRGMD